MTDRRLVLAALCPLALAPAARADIDGFGTFAVNDWHINQWDGSAPPTPSIANNSIRLTNEASGESRSIFATARQGVASFNASFTYQCTGTPTGGFGACFVLQTNAPTAVAVGLFSGVGTKFGYFDEPGTFRNNSVAISLEFGSLAAGSTSTNAYLRGNVGAGSSATGGVNLFSGHPIDVSLKYDGAIVQEHLLDTVTQATFDTAFALNNIAGIIGSGTAYVGFTACTGNNGTTSQYFSNLKYNSIPTPASASVLALGGLMVSRRRR